MGGLDGLCVAFAAEDEEEEDGIGGGEGSSLVSVKSTKERLWPTGKGLPISDPDSDS